MSPSKPKSAPRPCAAPSPRCRRNCAYRLILAEYEERTQAEIGQILDCTAKAVEIPIYRARRQLRDVLSKLMWNDASGKH